MRSTGFMCRGLNLSAYLAIAARHRVEELQTQIHDVDTALDGNHRLPIRQAVVAIGGETDKAIVKYRDV